MDSLLGPHIIDISCGDNYTIAVTSSGECYSWGSNKFGQLGMGNLSNQNEPKLVKELSHTSIESVSCGSTHSLFLSKFKEVYACGEGEAGQLG